jgi:PhzF family phenazine biosynthesis protein
MKLDSLIGKVFQVDAFTSEPFKGNPAGVVIMKDFSDVGFMQQMAAEMNLSETAFICEREGAYHIRYFTPNSEIGLCGHATLASAHVFTEQKIIAQGEVVIFKSTRHQLVIQTDDHGIHMQFPVYGISAMPITKEFGEITGLPEPQELYKGEHGWFMAYYADALNVIKAHPRLNHMKHTDFGQLIITAPGNRKEGFDYVLRCFVPAMGIDEDHVTGSAQCILGPFWQQKLHKTEFTALQHSQRSGIMHVRVVSEEKIQLSGSAVTVFEGRLRI